MSPFDPDRWRILSPLLDAALALEPEARESWLMAQRRADPDLAAELERLLSREVVLDEEGFLEPAPRRDAAGEAMSLAGTTVGAYVLERAIGTGGMGTVWLARRQDGRFEGSAAIKFLSLAVAGPTGEVRFRREGDALARLSHPNIARLLDAGVSAAGQPYLVLEYVDGEPLDAWCDRRRLPAQARLRLFLQVLAAVAHAHANLIVHRDLKPSNILVTADGMVKLLDFGIAKLLEEGRDGEATLTRDPLLTFEYASPEQVRGERVSTATDVYSLGVVLYRLLAERHPTSADCHTPVDHMRAILDTGPARLSQAVTPGGGPVTAEDATRVASARGTEPERLRRTYVGDLDNILAKALRKEASERYQTVTALANDIEHYLHHEPVSARPADWGYRAAKFLRRHRGSMTAAAVVTLALLSATGVAIRQMSVARRERDEALQALQRASALTTVEEVLGTDSRAADGRELSTTQRLQLALHVLEAAFPGQPSLVAEGTVDLANRYYEMGNRKTQRRLLGRARALARRAGLPVDLALADCARVYSFAYDEMLDSARTDLAEAMASLKRVGGGPDEVAILCLQARGQLLVAENRPDAAVPLLVRAVARSSTPVEPRDFRLSVLNDLAQAMRAAGRTRQGARYQRQIVLQLDSAGFGLTRILPDAASFLTSSLSELGELVAVDSVVVPLIREYEAAYGQGQASTVLAFLHGQNELRKDELDSAEVWIGRAIRDTTPQMGGIVDWAPAAIVQLRLEQGRMAEARAEMHRVPRDSGSRRAVAVLLAAELRWKEGEAAAALTELEDSLRLLSRPGGAPRPTLALPLVVAAEWRLAHGDAQGADSLAAAGIAAAAIDTLALSRSAWAGRGELVRARARRALHDTAGARTLARRALTALTNGAGPDSPWTLQARALVDSLRSDVASGAN